MHRSHVIVILRHSRVVVVLRCHRVVVVLGIIAVVVVPPVLSRRPLLWEIGPRNLVVATLACIT